MRPFHRRVESSEELKVAEYGSNHFQKHQDWKKTVLNGKTCQLSQKNSIGFYLAQATISLSG